jgi:hypothetical protein
MEGNYLPRISAVQLTARAYNSAIEKHSSLTVAHMQSLIQDGAEKRISYHYLVSLSGLKKPGCKIIKR